VTTSLLCVIQFISCHENDLETFSETKRDFFFVEIDYDDEDIECNLPLLDGAVLSATSSLNERGPENARLNGESSNSFHVILFCQKIEFVLFRKRFFVFIVIYDLFYIMFCEIPTAESSKNLVN
jgi:hypothetical protein